MRRGRAIALGAVFVIAACAGTPPAPVPVPSGAPPPAPPPEPSAAPDPPPIDAGASVDAAAALDASAAPVACADSSECAPGALCCPVPQRGKQTPFGPEHSFVSQCTAEPASTCEGHEICGAKPCRVPWPERKIACGKQSCSGPSSACRYHERGAKAPKCTTSEPELETFDVECTAASDCPAGTQCVLHYFSSLDSSCAYSAKASLHGAHTAPLCRRRADCLAALEPWRAFFDEEGFEEVLRETACVPVRRDPARRRACKIKNFAAFW